MSDSSRDSVSLDVETIYLGGKVQFFSIFDASFYVVETDHDLESFFEKIEDAYENEIWIAFEWVNLLEIVYEGENHCFPHLFFNYFTFYGGSAESLQ